MVEALVCANDWLRAEELIMYKDPTDEELELYHEIEEIEANVGLGNGDVFIHVMQLQGVDHSIRPEVWPFLLGVYSFNEETGVYEEMKVIAFTYAKCHTV
ncbi:hypothetical protein Dimus_023995 [Dionaea muscipula]